MTLPITWSAGTWLSRSGHIIGEVVEHAGGSDLLKAPPELPDDAKQAGLNLMHLAKETKDQRYLRLLP